MSSVAAQATEILKQAYGPQAEFRDGQLEAILSVVNKQKTLVVQRTGWGKSIVYFVATKILRDQGAGLTLIISPLLALMNNQIEAARKLGLDVATLNSENQADWEAIYVRLSSLDALIVSPERLANDAFREQLAGVQNMQLFVVDEAHAISDWGHDFRPDYQRIVKLLHYFPENIAVLGTTATANDRVIQDIKEQLGEDVQVVRGELMRTNLAIQTNPIQTPEERLAWLAASLSEHRCLNQGQGIVYCLTQRDTEVVASFLKGKGLCAESYHAGLETTESQSRLHSFSTGRLRILVATVKLGMGYDKADIRFVIHYQLPQNLIAYYQQIGRAGRDGQPATAILLQGVEDEEILNHFIQAAQVTPNFLVSILGLAEQGVKSSALLQALNIKKTKLEQALKYLEVNEHIYKSRSSYYRNIQSSFNAADEQRKQQAIDAVRRRELEQLKTYKATQACYMKFVADVLDAPDVQERCGICANCLGQEVISGVVDKELVQEAALFLKEKPGKISPRKKWGDLRNIPPEEQMQAGWVLSNHYYSQTGQMVKFGKYSDFVFSEKLVQLAAVHLREQLSGIEIDVVVPVPSLRRPHLVPDFTRQLAATLGFAYLDAVKKTHPGKEQKELQNSAQQQHNVESSIEIISLDVVEKTVLLVDDMVDSRWSLVVIAAALLRSGATAVYPYALVKTGMGDWA